MNKIQFTVYEAHSDCEWKRDRRVVGAGWEAKRKEAWGHSSKAVGGTRLSP